MKKEGLIPFVLLVIAIALTVVGFVFLPDTVITQFSIGADNVTKMPKTFAVAIPAVITIGGNVYALVQRNDHKQWQRGLVIAAVGFVIFSMMFAVNR